MEFINLAGVILEISCFLPKGPHSGSEQGDICQHSCPHSLSKNRCSHSLAEASSASVPPFLAKGPHSGPEQGDICQHRCPHSLSKSRCSHNLVEASSASVELERDSGTYYEAPLPVYFYKKQNGREALSRQKLHNGRNIYFVIEVCIYQCTY